MGSIPLPKISNLGLQVSLRAENNLNIDSFFLKHEISTGRVAVETDITLDNLRLLREIKESEREHTDTLVSPVIYANNWTKTMESLEE